MALTGFRDGFELDDHGILRDSFHSDFQVDEDGILRDDLDLLKQTVSTTGHGTDSGIGGDKQSSIASTLHHLHTTSFDEDLAPIGDESINISDFEASRDDLDSVEDDGEGDSQSKTNSHRKKESLTSANSLQQSLKESGPNSLNAAYGKGKAVLTEEYYQQLRDLGVLVDGADFSRDESMDLQLSGEQAGYDDDNRDLIGEYLQDQYETKHRYKEQEMRDHGKSHTGAVSQGSSHSLSEDMDMVFTESQPTADDDEIFLINRHLLPGSSHIQAEKLPVTTPSDLGSRPHSITSDVQARGSNRGYRSDRTVSSAVRGPSRSQANTPQKIRPDSVVSFASESIQPRSGASTPSKSSMSRARSQESFFEHGQQQGKSNEKLPKRILPTPSAADTTQAMRVKNKSKSVSNIARKSAPVKPTHMTISEINLTIDGGRDHAGGRSASAGPGTHDHSEGELRTQLRHELSKKEQATELVQQLKKEYGSLLNKFAKAELTIDQMRTSAHINLHADSPTPSSMQSGMLSPNLGAHKVKVLQLPVASGQRASLGSFPSLAGNGTSQASTQVQTGEPRSRLASANLDRTLTGVHGSLDRGLQGAGMGGGDEHGFGNSAMAAEPMTHSIHTQAVALNDRLDQFRTLVENRQLTLEEQEKAFENIRTDHEKLRRSYLQAKEDYNVLRRSGASFPPECDFDSNKELEGQLFHLGMKFDEIHEQVDTDLQHQSSRRQPFQTSRLVQQQLEEEDMDRSRQGTEQESENESQSVDSAVEKRVQHLHEEYRALMDRYRRLEHMSPTTETEKETDNLVRKLNDVCSEMPDMFRLSPEVKERWERIRRRDERRSPVVHGRLEGAVGGSKHSSPSSGTSPAPKMRGGHGMAGSQSRGSLADGRRGSRESFLDDDDSSRPTPRSLRGSRSSLASPRDHNSSTAGLPSGMSPTPQARSGPGPSGSGDGAAAPRGAEGYDPRINRPRRHKHDFQDPKSSKMADRGSYSSLADSGLSDEEGRDRHHDDALAQLPGPGKMKQLTHQRTENDMDSGFVGSVVSTQSAGPPPPPDPRRPENTLRLREPGSDDRSHNRSRRDSSASSTVASVKIDSETDGKSQRRLRTSAAGATLTGVGQHSVDKSYDGELDESTLSQLREATPRDARPKHPSDRSKPVSERPKESSERPKEPSERSKRSSGERKPLVSDGLKKAIREKDSRAERKEEDIASLSMSVATSGSHSDSLQDDETLEDISNEISDVSTPRHIETSTESHSVLNSTQPTQASATPYRPPTPSSPPSVSLSTPRTKQEATEAAEKQQAAAQSGAARVQSERPADVQFEQNTATQQGELPKPGSAAVQASSEQLQRPESRGAPTTDLFHTRPKRERHSKHSHDDSLTSLESPRPRSRHGRRRSRDSLDGVKAEDRGVGSDVEIGSNATRGSSIHSARLHALQEEIEKLKSGLQQANDRASERPEPLPPPPAQQPQEPEYYDPFDDPYGFMRMPRRRANSFSGGRVREFDEWYWTLPNDRRHNDEDIPLGYAAADAYNLNYQPKTPEAARERLRRRRDRHRQGDKMGHPRGAANERHEELLPQAGTANPLHGAIPPTVGANPLLPPSATTASDSAAAFNYYVPRRRSVFPESQGQGPNVNPYRQHTTPLFASQPDLSATLAGVEPADYGRQEQAPGSRPWYTIRRSQGRPASSHYHHPSAAGQYGHTQQQGFAPQSADVYHHQQQQQQQAYPSYSYYSSYASSDSTTPVQNGTGYWTEACPLCGGTGAHIHEEDSQAVPSYGYLGHSKKRSRSMPRSRRYRFSLKHSGSRSRYHVKEFEETDSEGSEVEYAKERHRSHSWSRSRRRSKSPSSSRRRSSRRHSGHHQRRKQRAVPAESIDLDQSLALSEDISRLTKRMMGTVHGELSLYRDRKEFGSSYW